MPYCSTLVKGLGSMEAHQGSKSSILIASCGPQIADEHLQTLHAGGHTLPSTRPLVLKNLHTIARTLGWWWRSAEHLPKPLEQSN